MNAKTYFLLIIALSLLISACSRKGGSDGVDMKEVIIVEDLTPEEKEKLFKSSGILFRENQTLADNLARIETTRNAQGMKIEKYFYNNLPSLQYIEIFTFANGQKQIAIHNANGNVKNLSENSLAWLAKASPEEITGEATVAAEQQKENSSSGGITINKLPPIVVNSSPLPTPAQKIEEPKNEKPNESNTKTAAPTQKKETTSPN